MGLRRSSSNLSAHQNNSILFKGKHLSAVNRHRNLNGQDVENKILKLGVTAVSL